MRSEALRSAAKAAKEKKKTRAPPEALRKQADESVRERVACQPKLGNAELKGQARPKREDQAVRQTAKAVRQGESGVQKKAPDRRRRTRVRAKSDEREKHP